MTSLLSRLHILDTNANTRHCGDLVTGIFGPPRNARGQVVLAFESENSAPAQQQPQQQQQQQQQPKKVGVKFDVPIIGGTDLGTTDGSVGRMCIFALE